MSFIYFKCLPDLKSFLKQEIILRIPGAKFSFSAAGFLTYKVERLEDFTSLRSWAYALEWGICLNLQRTHDLQKLHEKSVIFQVNEGFSAEIEVMPGSAFTFMNLEVENNQIPSRTYFKMAQAHEWLGLPDRLSNEECVLEIGSAPGGTAYFWVEREQRIIGVDPGEMDNRVTQSPFFRHIKRGVQYLKTIDFTTFEKEKVSLITVDMNLSAFQSAKETLNVFQMFPLVNIILLTIKTPKISDVEKLSDVVRKFERAGFTDLRLRSLPAHKRETLLVARR